MDLTVDFFSKDSLHAVMNNMVARDSVTGFNVKNMHFGVGVLKDRLHLDHIMLQQESTAGIHRAEVRQRQCRAAQQEARP